jgi:hypothetical protein
MSQLNPGHMTSINFYKIHFNVFFFHFLHGLPSSYFLLRIKIKIMYMRSHPPIAYEECLI